MGKQTQSEVRKINYQYFCLIVCTICKATEICEQLKGCKSNRKQKSTKYYFIYVAVSHINISDLTDLA